MDDIKEILDTPLISEEEIAEHLNPLKDHWKSKLARERSNSGGDAVNPELESDEDVVIINGVKYRKAE